MNHGFDIITHSNYSDDKLGPVQKLRKIKTRPEDIFKYPADEFTVITSNLEIDDFNAYVSEISFDPNLAKLQVSRLLLLYIASITYAILSFDEDEVIHSDLIENCHNLAKSMYMFYKDLNTILWAKQIESVWKTYLKLNTTARLASNCQRIKMTSCRTRVLTQLHLISKRIRVFT